MNKKLAKQTLWLALSLSATAHAVDLSDELFDMDNLDVWITPSMPHTSVQHKGEEVVLMRHQGPDNPIHPRFMSTSRPCPPFCVQPMSLHPDVETIGEIELIDYVRKISAGDSSIVVIDSRTDDWTRLGTIPGSVNIPWVRLDPSVASDEEISELLQLEFNGIRNGELWHFSNAKTLVLFCNGPWCGQSPTNIRALLALGYPAERIKWYRGGMQSWEQFGFSTVDIAPVGAEQAPE